jgi:hypothetical protein
MNAGRRIVHNDLELSNTGIISVISFSIFLIPYSIGTGLSANYLYVFYPVVYMVINKKIYTPDSFSFIMFLYISFYFVGVLNQNNTFEFVRAMISCILFLAMFSFVFMRFDLKIINSFKIAIIVMSLYYSIFHIILFYEGGGSTAGFAQKSITGGSRYGFVYIMAFWLLCLWDTKYIFSIFKYLCIILCVTGILLTFSRSSIISFVFSILIYLLFNIPNIKINKYKNLVRLLFISTTITIGILIINKYFNVTLVFFETRILNDLLDGSLMSRITNPVSSVGTRVFVLGSIINNLLESNPITGSGYIGVWSLKILEGIAGSAHSQYADVLFRTGFLGLFIYFYLLLRLYKFLKNSHPDLFFGFIGILIYGIFHETFKESQGGFILAFLLGMYQTHMREIKNYWKVTKICSK